MRIIRLFENNSTGSVGKKTFSDNFCFAENSLGKAAPHRIFCNHEQNLKIFRLTTHERTI